MRQSKLFYKAQKHPPKGEEAINAQLLVRAGFIDKVAAGVYSYLPLGLRVLKKIEQIVREEVTNIDGQEILMPALHPKELWQQTNRWDSMSVLFKLKGMGDKDFALGPTHEETVTPLAQKVIFSYKDLPMMVYQIQTKFRNEARSKSGLLRGREFLMKDLYSFHENEEDLDNYYKRAEKAYEKILMRLGVGDISVKTFASGGDFSKYSHEYQTFCDTGEDDIYWCEKCNIAVNKEIIEEQNKCPECGNDKLEKRKASEIGNIFKLKTKFSGAFDFKYTDEQGNQQPVFMGCYGFGLSRAMGILAEIFNDARGLMWPESVSPYKFHLLNLNEDSKLADDLYKKLIAANQEVLYDDRNEISAGEKLAESDLIGITHRLVVSKKTGDKVEYKKRSEKDVELISENDLIKLFKK